MRRVLFRSSKFPSYGTKEEGVNFDAGIFGKRLAEYLQEKLPAEGFPVKFATDEDWGWYIELTHELPFRLAVCCGAMTESKADEEGFACFVDPMKPRKWHWYRFYDATETIARVERALDAILRSDPEITNVAWEQSP